MRIAVAATPDVALPTLDALLKSEHELVCVITRADAPAGRGRELQSSPVSQWALKNGVVVHKPISGLELGEVIANVDLVITIGYGFIIPESVLLIPKHGFINLHFSLLPRWRGAAPVQRAIEAGDKTTGVTVFQLDKGMDTGPIYRSSQVELSPEDNSADLLQTLAVLGVDQVLETVKLIAAGYQPIKQSEIGVTRADKLSKDEGHINWGSDAISIKRKINAFNPNPGAWSIFREQNLKINRVRLSEHRLAIGKIELVSKSVLVGTSTDALELLEVTPSGKSKLPATSWANGARITSEDFLR